MTDEEQYRIPMSGDVVRCPCGSFHPVFSAGPDSMAFSCRNTIYYLHADQIQACNTVWRYRGIRCGTEVTKV